MIVLGVSGFEQAGNAAEAHPFRGRPTARDGALSFQGEAIPLQGFPLGLIGHDGAAALLVDGSLVAAASEERFTRLKHGFNLAGHTILPRRAIRFCLERAGITAAEIDCVAHYCRFTEEGVEARLAEVGSRFGAGEQALLRDEYARAYARRLAPNVVRAGLEAVLGRSLADGRLVHVPHHFAHAAGAYFSSGYDEALCLTLDGYGEAESSIAAIARPDSFEPVGVTRLPTSLGTLYQILTTFLGFGSFGDEYKVMGLAAYGDPRVFEKVLRGLVELGEEGSYTTERICRPDLLDWLADAFGGLPVPGPPDGRSADIAAALQAALDRTALHVLRHWKDRTGASRLCLAGGVALNASMNGAIVRSRLFEHLFVQPAAGDDGAAMGAALYAHHLLHGARRREPVAHVYWGPDFDDEQIAAALAAEPGLTWERAEDIAALTARLLEKGRIVGWFQGRMEVGPRALGARSILATPTSVAIRERINALVKCREAFRPFAPSVLAEDAGNYFDIPDDAASPYMIVTYPARPAVRKTIEGVVHADGSSRVQTVREEENPLYHRLLRAFRDRTGLPLLLNTSFNRAGEPIVCTPRDAIRCFLESGLDALAIGNQIAFPRGAATRDAAAA
ncbi:MAG TPA: carbamoyltransferase C-terminal domain-containing protein [Candidatus Eisenbacteria bacterium]|nr:carbamoyltransferase C-terminal domain-containing protein [Candidatus Eisenbacteria bacterium]